MRTAINRVIEIEGGLVIVNEGEILGELTLPVAGLINDQLTASELTKKMANLTNIAREKLGVKVRGPFMHLGFLSLTTAPTWKITDQGLVDVNNHRVIPTIK